MIPGSDLMFDALEKWLADIRDGRVYFDSEDMKALEKLILALKKHRREFEALKGSH